ncbi:hypothetical protein BASA50_011408 [Batrachochytrium salamandrivorans]|uniref:PSI domain-containing protein n=1 Tax=Batrachochytrium salamandrivorans TaxID=1357716 RepID=A0ABQ8EW92_9FUNG|nr:hypothetical protein BASA62_009296 [Batrachochytrium salamandrivorans]KAH6563737.1 hypothetical protein BASA60_010619 [Batrachochytrium salamandrivorans]KAH6587405.1 hypothetical protein BASA50_011408 [Batrachochytrium salamandrivorans]KAH6594480.1 hypothetical protein BASA61_004017 [Batrachochytrium salamandrivorans]
MQLQVLGGGVEGARQRHHYEPSLLLPLLLILSLLITFSSSQTLSDPDQPLNLPTQTLSEFHMVLNSTSYVDFTCKHGSCIQCLSNDTSTETYCSTSGTRFHEDLQCSSPLVNGTIAVDWQSLLPGIVEPKWRSCSEVQDPSFETWALLKFEILNIIGLAVSASMIFLQRRTQRIEQYRRLATRSTEF